MAKKNSKKKQMRNSGAKLLAAALVQAAKPKASQASGKGAYAFGRGKYGLGKGLGGMLGGMAGMAMGNPAMGAMLGRAAGGGIQRSIKGRGAYRTNDLVNGMLPTGQIPSFGTPDENGNIRIRHKEYIGDIFSPTVPADFTLQSFALNPALSGVFPWLSQTAANYDEYEFRGLIFTFNPVISDSSNSGAMGTVIMATVYNAGATPFASKQQMLEYSGSVSARICDTIVHGVECDPVKNGGSAIEYTRAGAVPAGQDIKTYDLGVFQIATSGVSAASFPAGTQLGELWVSYDVVLRKPKFWDNLGYSILTDSFFGTVGITTTLPLGSAPLKSGLNSLGGTITKSNTTIYTFPDNFAGYVQVVYAVTAATSSSFSAASITGGGNVSSNDSLFFTRDGVANTSYHFSSGTTAASESIMVRCYRVKQASAAGTNTLTFSMASLVGAGSQCTIVIGEMNPLMGPPLAAGAVPTNYVAV